MNESKCTLQIDTKVIRANYAALRKVSPNAEVSAVIKSNAYGLGALDIAPFLQKDGCCHFFVATCEEGVALRRELGKDVQIYVMKGVFKSEISEFLEYKLVPVLNHITQVEIWQDQAVCLNKKLPCILHFDTGMHRLGMPYEEIKNLSVGTDMYKLDILYIMSHLISAEDKDSELNQQQLERFKKYTQKFEGIKLSLANSSGAFLGTDYHFDLIRPGAALYGINPTPYLEESPIKNPVKLLAPIIQIHQLPPDESVGYNATYVNRRNLSCPIATIPIGYADGFLRAFSNRGEVYINGYKAPIIGRVSMDFVTIDVSLVPQEEIFLGAPVEIIGDNATPDKLAKILQTNSYEILTMLGDRYEKIYN